jgi:hypothetical protein
MTQERKKDVQVSASSLVEAPYLSGDLFEGTVRGKRELKGAERKTVIVVSASLQPDWRADAG